MALKNPVNTRAVKKRRIKLRANGLCQCCGANGSISVFCDTCKSRSNKKQRDKYNDLKNRGVCTKCRKNQTKPGTTRCSACSSKHVAALMSKLKTDQQYRLALRLRIRLNMAIRNEQKKGSAVSDLGCTIEELRVHLQSKFVDGMTWDNYGKWHIDHVVPLIKFDLSDREQFLKAVHYTNLQPLWQADNDRKGSKL